jgi:uncharacterized membrane protein YhaH (DUF805 family)
MTDGASVSAFSFQGRISRASFWGVIGVTLLSVMVLGVLIALLVPSLSATKLNSGGEGMMMVGIGLIYALALWTGLANYAKRLHDIDHSGWLALLIAVPLVNLILLIYCGAKEGSTGPNRFGPGPLKVRL